MIKLHYIFILLCLFGCNHPESKDFKRYKDVSTEEILNTELNSETDSYKVVGIKDGDTFVVLIDGKEQDIRLGHIDCPEKKQPFGTKAKQLAFDLCFGQFVQLNHKNKYDRNKRLIAEIILQNGVNVNKELVDNGLAWHFKKYSDNEEYAELELKARNNRIGIWSEPNPTAPWNWRKK
ncbi:MAG: thermonuclease family protein [Saprospiraceae bacterium]|nr:thermonuclease family protein [Saprospiraceae bacterium]